MKKVITGNCLKSLKELPDKSIDCIVTSPPYYGLRDYGTGEWVGGDPNCPHRRMSKYSKDTITGHAQEELHGNVGDAIYKTVCPLCGAIRIDEQIGLEETPQEYINNLVEVFRECKRVLKDDGTLWVNIGDSYAAQRSGTHQPAETLAGGEHGVTKEGDTVNRGRERGYNPTRNAKAIGLKHKDMIGIPWMLAFALRDDGWYLRQDIIWHKPNPMPESVKDRCTKSHEYIFLLSKSQKYYFDAEAISEPIAQSSKQRYKQAIEHQEGSNRPQSKQNGNMKAVMPRFGGSKYGDNKDKHYQLYSGKEWVPKHKNLEYKGQQNHSMHERRAEGFGDIEYATRNKRDVWTVATQAVKEAHFATFPEKLIEPCILAGCPTGGVVLDPFCGSGTTGIVAVRNERDFIGLELNPEYAEMSMRRITKEEEQGIQTSFL